MNFNRLNEIIKNGKTEIKQSEKGIIINFVFKDIKTNELRDFMELTKKDFFIENRKLKFNILTYMEGIENVN